MTWSSLLTQQAQKSRFSNRLVRLMCFRLLYTTYDSRKYFFSDRKWHSWCRWRSHSNNHFHQPIKDSTDKLDSQPWRIWFEFPRSYIFHRVSHNSIFSQLEIEIYGNLAMNLVPTNQSNTWLTSQHQELVSEIWLLTSIPTNNLIFKIQLFSHVINSFKLKKSNALIIKYFYL